MKDTADRKGRLIHLSDILEELFKTKASIFSDIYFLYCLKKSWAELAGREIARTGTPVSFKNRELTLALPSSSHLQEMHFVREALRNKINSAFPHAKVEKILLSVGDS